MWQLLRPPTRESQKPVHVILKNFITPFLHFLTHHFLFHHPPCQLMTSLDEKIEKCLSFLFKILKGTVYKQLSLYVTQNNPQGINWLQSTHSIETALMGVTEKFHATSSAKLSAGRILFTSHKTLVSPHEYWKSWHSVEMLCLILGEMITSGDMEEPSDSPQTLRCPTRLSSGSCSVLPPFISVNLWSLRASVFIICTINLTIFIQRNESVICSTVDKH